MPSGNIQVQAGAGPRAGVWIPDATGSGRSARRYVAVLDMRRHPPVPPKAGSGPSRQSTSRRVDSPEGLVDSGCALQVAFVTTPKPTGRQGESPGVAKQT